MTLNTKSFCHGFLDIEIIGRYYYLWLTLSTQHALTQYSKQSKKVIELLKLFLRECQAICFDHIPALTRLICPSLLTHIDALPALVISMEASIFHTFLDVCSPLEYAQVIMGYNFRESLPSPRSERLPIAP